MVQQEKLHKAVELAIEAGYQLDQESFNFLSLISTVKDPTNIINKAIQKMAIQKEKQLFIDKKFLEKIVESIEPVEEVKINSLEDINTMAMMEHERWMAEKVKDGWNYGMKKDFSARTNPDLLPWDKLSKEVKDKDRNTVKRIPEYLKAASLEIFRL